MDYLRLKKIFELLNIEVQTFEHEPIFTIEQAQRVANQIPGPHAKNLFLKDSKKNLWLLVVSASTSVPLKKVAKKLKAPELRFADEKVLKECLGVMPGAVTPLGLIFDSDHRVQVVIEKKLITQNRIGFHPLRNNATTMITPQDLLKFIDYTGHRTVLLDIDELSN